MAFIVEFSDSKNVLAQVNDLFDRMELSGTFHAVITGRTHETAAVIESLPLEKR